MLFRSIGGNGADKLTGQYNDDILVGGRTKWDDYPARLVDMLPEWLLTNVDYTTRVGHLNGTTTGDQNRGVLLEYRTVNNVLQQTVYDDGVPDTLTGSGGSDWYVANQTDVLNDAAKKDSILNNSAEEVVLNVVS